MVLGAVDGVIETDVEVGGTGGDSHLLLCGHAHIAALFGGGGDGADAELYCLLICLFGKGAGEGVGTGVLYGGEVEWDERETLACAAGGKDDFVVIAEGHQFFDVGFYLLVYYVIVGVAVADLKDGHACAVKVQQLALGFL